MKDEALNSDPWTCFFLIINAGGIIIDNGLMVEAKANFEAWTIKRRVIIKIICIEEIVGFSFFETNIKIPELISASAKLQIQEKVSEIFKGVIRSNLKEEIIEIKMQIKKIMRLSIFEILVGCFIGTWLLLHR